MDLSKRMNPIKNYMKMLCKVIYYLGLGNCWYEDNKQSQLQRKLYQIWMAVANFYAFSFAINEFLAHFRSDLNDKEKNDLIQFTFAHSVISAKIIATYIEKKRIREVLEKLLEANRSVFISKELEKACVKRSARLCVAIGVIGYMTLLASTIDGIRAYIIEGIPIRTEVTLYPSPSSSGSGVLVNVLKFFIQLHWWFIVAIMTAIDSFCISSLVIMGYKFKLLQLYFLSLREKVLENTGRLTRKALEEEFMKDFVVGIKMHEDVLWCAKNVQRTLRNLYSIQVFETVVLLVMCLIKLVTVEHNLFFLVANFGYIACVILLTGAYMMPAGDITQEASSVSMAIFHSGWELVSGRDLRILAVLALQRSQVPVCMSAFGIITLSYTNFISVIRSSYSFFAVMY